MQQRSGFQLFAALRQREFAGEPIYLAQMMPKLIRRAERYMGEYAACTDIEKTLEILLELKELVLLDVECVFDFYCDELWKITGINAEAFELVRNQISKDILEIVNLKPHPKLCLYYFCIAVGFSESDLDFGVPDIKNAFDRLERAASGKGHYATRSAYLLFIIYAQERYRDEHNLSFDQIFIYFTLILGARAGLNNIQDLQFNFRKALVMLGYTDTANLFYMLYLSGDVESGIPADDENYAILEEHDYRGDEFLSSKIKKYYRLACHNIVNYGFISFELENVSRNIFNLMKTYADLVGGRKAEFKFTYEVRKFKRQLEKAANEGNIEAMILLARLGDLKCEIFFKLNDIPNSYLQIIRSEFSVVDVIDWCKKIVALETTETSIQARAARKLVISCDDPVRKLPLLQDAVKFGCWRSLIDLGEIALRTNEDENAVCYFQQALNNCKSSESLHPLHRVLTTFKNIDVINRKNLLPTYFRINEILICAGEAFQLKNLIALVATLNDVELNERWKGVARMYDDHALDRNILSALVQETVDRLMEVRARLVNGR